MRSCGVQARRILQIAGLGEACRRDFRLNERAHRSIDLLNLSALALHQPSTGPSLNKTNDKGLSTVQEAKLECTPSIDQVREKDEPTGNAPEALCRLSEKSTLFPSVGKPLRPKARVSKPKGHKHRGEWLWDR